MEEKSLFFPVEAKERPEVLMHYKHEIGIAQIN